MLVWHGFAEIARYMLSKREQNLQIDYWLNNSKRKIKTMKALYASKRYDDCLFFGHLILEYALKALVVQNTKEIPPKIHNLPRLAEIANLSLDTEDTVLLVEANEFNMEARYPEQKHNFYKRCTKAYTDTYYTKILFLYKRLCQLVK